MQTQTVHTNPIVIFAAFVIVLAGIKAASVIVVPFLLALFLAIIISPLFLFLRRKNIPKPLALLSVLVVLFTIIWKLVIFLGVSVGDFSQNVPQYQAKLQENMIHFFNFLKQYDVEIPQEEFFNIISVNSIMAYIAKTLKSFTSLLTNFFMIFLMVAFILLEISSFSRKMEKLNSKTLNFIAQVSQKIQHFILLKSLTSLATGIIISLSLYYLGIDYAFLWGLIAFLLNFVPNIGSIIASVPALLITLVQYDFKTTLIVGGIYLSVNVIIGSILEPKIMGDGLGLSTLVVFLSLIFWGWLLGPVGMLLSIPLTIMVKIVLDQKPQTRHIAVLLGN
jgi:predicted PurR-regulated permease PerM